MGTSGPYLLKQGFVPVPVEGHNSNVLCWLVEHMHGLFNVVSNATIKRDMVPQIRTSSEFVHVTIGGVEQRSSRGGCEDGNRIW